MSSASSDPPEAATINEPSSRDASYWAKPNTGLTIAAVPTGAMAFTVQGRRVNNPVQGFGQMWQKTYRVRLRGVSVSPLEVIRVWKERFPEFWPRGSTFFAPLTGIAPGEIALLSLAPMPGPIKLSTGVLVLYADAESFTLMSPQGHMFAGWITFSASQQDGDTVVQAQALIRANDPLYELGMMMGGSKQEDLFWEHTVRSLAEYFGVHGEVETQVKCVDGRRQWSRVGNVWFNAGIRSSMYMTMAPLRWMAGRFRKPAPVR